MTGTPETFSTTAYTCLCIEMVVLSLLERRQGTGESTGMAAV